MPGNRSAAEQSHEARIEILEEQLPRLQGQRALLRRPDHGQVTLVAGVSPAIALPNGLAPTSSIKLTKRVQVGDNATIEYVALFGDRVFGVPGSFIARALVSGGGGGGGLAGGVPLGTAATFGILAGSGITNTGVTVINGDVGTFPTPAETGFGTVTVNGINHGADVVTQQAKVDLVTAYNTAAGLPGGIVIPDNLAAQNLTTGVYDLGAGDLPVGALLTFTGNATDTFVVRAASSLTLNNGSSIVLAGGALAKNVLFLVGSSATIGTGVTEIGTIIALTSITVATGSTTNGALLARNGAVTLQGNTVTATAGGGTAGADGSTLDYVVAL